MALDVTDRRILAELQADARLSLAELGRRVGLSAPAVAERLSRLRARAGIAPASAVVSKDEVRAALDDR
jgi:Lrp/AsnC family leucine-responsive transcriptional regulator